MRKQVKIKFVDYWGSFSSEIDDCLILNILRKYYDVVICDDADYVFFSTMGESHWSVPDDCIKIFQTGENLVPDFNACDYAIGFEWMDYEDRYIRFPTYLFYEYDILNKMEHKHEIPENYDVENEKPGFCSFVVSNPRNPHRNYVFHELCKYKIVDSGGRYLNNIGGAVKNKFTFECSHKFSLCFENGAHNGYTTEKLVQAFAARTIPIYWGDPKVNKVFNTKSFINAWEYENLEDVIEKVKEIDANRELYIQILREPALLPTSRTVDEEIEIFEQWLLHIFEQPIEKARRRNREMHGKWYVERRYRLDKKANAGAIWQLNKMKAKNACNYYYSKFFRKK